MTVTKSRITGTLTSTLAPTKPLLPITAYSQAATPPCCLLGIFGLYSMFTDASVVFGSIRAGSSSIRAGYYFFPKHSSKVLGPLRDVCRLIAQITSFISSHVWSLAPEGWMVYQVESCGYQCNILTPCVECTDRFRHRSTIRLEGHHHHPSSPSRNLENHC